MADTLYTRGPSNVTTLLATTMENRRGAIADAVFSELVLFNFLYENGQIKTDIDGGTSIVTPVMTSRNTTAAFYDGYGILDTTPQEGFTDTQYKWKQAAVSITVSGREDRIQNQGSSRVHSIVESKQKQAEMSLKDLINQKLFGSGNASTEITSLVTLIDATSTIGDINSTANSFWQASVTTSGSFAAQGLSDMRTLYYTLEKRNPIGGPKKIITTSAVYGFYEGSLIAQQRYQSADTGNASFSRLRFKDAEIDHDPQCTSGAMYFLHPQALELYVASNTDFILTNWKEPKEQDAKVAQLLVALELATPNRRKLGKMLSITA